ncbi:MAG: phosphofructokinase [Acidimicrobiaceae bacterium]|nr:6-phosphofructokinase [Acidimicrobiaceae bacterium]MXW75076.1 phosphofructokinase [Acidimicrobiaceae bacterium]MYA74198.1 phosphofructokinase [Acidimicrobiaceae bacterium]MYD07599.1 phosphofructokinase [Acidimicrobiaceae bacterium]MYG55204.1 phosphofructokinase [Acidimicrobiaceae bacterium]
MKIAVLTGGGDVPGLNPCLKTAVNRICESGSEVVGIRRGWGGLVNADPNDEASLVANTMVLTPGVVRKIDRTGGTFLHTSRSNPGKVSSADVPPFLRSQHQGDGPHDLTPNVVAVLEALGVDALIAIGGDDTLSYALRMHNEGVPVIAIPKTMDNDVHGTDYCIGFSTAISRGVEFIHNLRTSTGSHERIAVIELFGRYSGETSLITAYLAGVDRALISEVPFDIDKLAELVMKDKSDNPSNYAMVTVSEGASIEGGEIHLSGEADAYGHRKLGGIGATTGALLTERTGEGIILQEVAYLMRSGRPDSLDLMVASNYAVMASNLALEGVSGRMVALQGGVYTNVSVAVTGEGARRVDVDELYDIEQYRPLLRHVAGKPMFLY